MSERLVVVIEYDAGSDLQQALNDAMTQIQEGAGHLDPEHVKAVQVHVAIDDFAERVLALFDEGT